MDIDRGRRWIAERRLHAGDGHALKPYRWWNTLSRTLFYAQLRGSDGVSRTYAVSVNYADSSGHTMADLYVDGKNRARSRLPARFPAEDGVIEVKASGYGLKRMHYVDAAGSEHVLTPDPRSPEGRRRRLAARAPRLSQGIGIAAAVVLLVALPLGVLQMVQVITHIEVVAAHVDPFTSPIALSGWMNVAMTVLGLVAGTERALMLRNHWLIDMETTVFDG